MSGPEDPTNYNLDQVTCNFAGIAIESGYGDGGAIKIEKADPAFTTKAGADGTIVRSKTGRRLYKVTITFLQTAAANQVLSAIHQADVKKKNGIGVAPLSIVDGNGSSLHIFSKAWIVTDPMVEYGAEATNREWEFAAWATVANVGSN